jgi:hypothetical protein
MRQPFIIIGAGTEVVNRVVLPTCVRLRDEAGGWPDHVYALATDGDEQTRSRHAAARLPADRVPFVPLSMVQVREALAWRRTEFRDAWRDDWESLLVHGPDNGACMVPAIGRLMVKAARPMLMQHLQAFARRLAAQGGKAPEIFIVWSPVSGTSRGSVLDLPRYVRSVFPDAAIQGVILFPVGAEELDPAVGRIFQANFVEALRLIDHHARVHTYEAWVDDSQGWQSFDGRLVDNVFAFDERYGNTRWRHLGTTGRRLGGRLEALSDRVVDFLAGTIGGDRLYERTRARFADAEMHWSDRVLAGHRTYVHAVHETRAWVDLADFKRALAERALMRLGSKLFEAMAETGSSSGLHGLFGVNPDEVASGERPAVAKGEVAEESPAEPAEPADAEPGVSA